jgi:heavy metal sensor kinase
MSARPRPLLHGLGRVWRTLRFRLAAWNALVVVLTAVVTLVGLRQGVRWTLMHELDQILLEDVAEVELSVRDTPARRFSQLTDSLNRKALGHKHHGWFVRLDDPQGRPLWQSEGAPPEAPSLVAPVEGLPATVDNYRIVERRVDADDGVGAIQIGASLDLLHEDLARLDRLVLIAAGVVLLVAPPVGYWLARRAANTVGEIIDTASRLRPSHLEERLPIQGTGDELDHLAHTVNGLLDRIAVYLQQRRDFLANAAHELRTPLAAIRSSVEVALGGNRSPREYQELLEDVIEQGTVLEALVNQLLLLSETEAERVKAPPEPVRLDEVVAKAVDMFRGVAEARGIELQADPLDRTTVLGNRGHLRQVVNNLIDNAVKYTAAGGRIRVRLTNDEPLQTARLSVADTGVGIATEDVPRVFERFFRGDRSRTREGGATGTGLGLSICQAVVAAHHGEISCESKPGEGTTFYVRLPSVSPARQASSTPIAAAAG